MTSEQELTTKVEPVRRTRSVPKTGLIGPVEIIGLAAAALLLLATIVTYFYVVLPAHSRLRTLQADRETSEKSIKSLTTMAGANLTANERVQQLVGSLDTFEQNALGTRNAGRTALYDRLNEIMRENNLRNTAGPTYGALIPLDPKSPAATQAKSGNAKFQSVYPGIGVNVTVEGTYAGIRRFVHDLEAMPQFVIVNSVELEDVTVSDQTGGALVQPAAGQPQMLNPRGRGPASGAAPQAGPPSGPRTGASLVSLHLDMSVYFRRQDADPAPAGN